MNCLLNCVPELLSDDSAGSIANWRSPVLLIHPTIGRFLDARYSHVAPREIASSIQIRDGFSKLVELPLSSKER